jgi:hypothetical protein
MTTVAGHEPDDDFSGRIEALRQANEIRVKRAQLKMRIRNGTVAITQVIADPPDFVTTMRVFDLLYSDPAISRLRAERLLDDCGLSKQRTFGHLSDCERQALISRISL